jgi:hypothetical protein
MCYPLIGIIITASLYFYMRSIYAKLVNTAEDYANIRYKDFENGDYCQFNMIIESNCDPVYLIKYKMRPEENVEPTSKFHE